MALHLSLRNSSGNNRGSSVSLPKQAEWWPCLGPASPTLSGGIARMLRALGRQVRAEPFSLSMCSPSGLRRPCLCCLLPRGQSLQSSTLHSAARVFLPIMSPTSLLSSENLMRYSCWECFANTKWAELLRGLALQSGKAEFKPNSPLSDWVTLQEPLNLSKPQCFHLQSRNNHAYLTVLPWSSGG